MPNVKYTDFGLYRRLLGLARPYWLHIAGIFLLSLLSTPLALLTPLPLKIVVDSVIGDRPIPGFLDALFPTAAGRSSTAVLVLAIILLVATGLLSHVQSLGSWLLQTYTGEKLVLDFRAQLFRRVQRISLAYHDTRGTTDSTYRIQYDAPSIQHIAINGVIPFITASCTFVGMLYVIARLDWQLAVVAFVVSPVLILITRASRWRLRSGWDEVKKLESSAMAVVQEALSSLRVVKAFGREDQEQERFIRHSSKGVRGQIYLAFVQGGFDLLIGLTIVAGTAGTLVIGVIHVQSAALTLGELLMVMAYVTQLYGPLETISRKVADVQSSLASAQRAFALLDRAPDVFERENARAVSRARGAVVFKNVDFSYCADRPALYDISFEIQAGTRVGIMGKTGAGKTTLVSLLTRFYDPSAGQILLDGVDLRDYRLADLRNQFAIVLQEPVLFSTSIAENIAYARPGASEEEIISAAKAANAHDFILNLPEGYQTLVGDRGMRLSGGERQRVSLARAFLKDAPILILDEPTSSVDVNTEAAIMKTMERLMQGRTTFLIAHRMSTLQNCDLRLVIDDGRLVEVSDSRVEGALVVGGQAELRPTAADV
jgi:ATP-binding cassette subfamily B protein